MSRPFSSLRCKAYYRQARNVTPRCVCPALLLRGAGDGVVSAADAAALAAALGAECATVEATGHVPQLEAPDRVSELIEAFVRSL